MKKKKEITIRIKELNNKTRKGQYIYIKRPNKKGAYYQYQEEQPADFYITYYDNKEKRKQEKTSLKTHLKEYNEALKKVPTIKKSVIRTEAEKYLKKIKRQYGGKTLEKMLAKGIKSNIIQNAHTTNPRTIKTNNILLLQGLVLDKQLINIMAEEENMKKIKNRLEQRINIIDEKGTVLMTMNTFGKTTQETINEIKNTTPKGLEIRDTPANTYTMKMKSLGYENINFQESGKTGRVQIITIMRKAK